MKKNNERDGDTGKSGECQTCLGYIPIERNFEVGDLIDCYECETSYIIESKNPVKLSMIDDHYEDNHYIDDNYEDDHYEDDHYEDDHYVDDNYVDDHYEDDDYFREMSFDDR